MFEFGKIKNKNNLATIFISVATTIVVFFLIELVILPSLGLNRKTEQKNKSGFSGAQTEVKQAGIAEQARGEAQIKMKADNATTENLIKKVFSHIFLPKGDIQVEAILKPDELRKINPIFYQYAKAGDIVLIYSDRAILYDPVADKVLDVLHIVK